MPRRLIIISGAGTGAESGIRTFRTDEVSGKSLWDEYDVEEVCNINSFNTGFYSKTHEFYNDRRVELAGVQPNAFHHQVAEWYKSYPGLVKNITTNVDDLLERSGIPSPAILHVHGYLPEVILQKEPGDPKKIVDIGYSRLNPEDYHWCKPNVVFFGEYPPQYAEMNRELSDLRGQDLVIVVGCSGVVIDFIYELVTYQHYGNYKIWCVNPKPSNYEVQKGEDGDIVLWKGTAVEVFENKNFIAAVKKHMEG